MPKRFLKWPIKNVLRIILFLIVAALPWLYFLDISHQKEEISPEERKIVLQHAEHITETEEGVLISDSLQLEKSFLDNSHRRFIVALYLIESMRGGNSDEMMLSIFEKQGNDLQVVLDKLISHRSSGYYDRFEVKDKKILLFGLKGAENDALCCPSIPVAASLQLKSEQLVLLEGKLLTD